MLQKTKLKIAIYVVVSLNLLALFIFWIYWSSAQARDYQRLADLKIWQSILSSYYSENGSYLVPNCTIGKTLSGCLIKKVGRFTINNINDPLNYGNYRYVIEGLSDSDYQISFFLEAGVGGLSRGVYILTKDGVKK